MGRRRASEASAHAPRDGVVSQPSGGGHASGASSVLDEFAQKHRRLHPLWDIECWSSEQAFSFLSGFSGRSALAREGVSCEVS